MQFVFKLNPDASHSEWVGWFGEYVLKARVASSRETMFETFLQFLETDLGIQHKDVKIVHQDIQKRVITLELPDQAWELFLGVIEK